MALRSDIKFERKLTCASKNDMKNFANFHQSFIRKSEKLNFYWVFFIKNRKCMSLQFTEELCVMKMKNDAKIEENLTCQFKIDMKNLLIFHPST